MTMLNTCKCGGEVHLDYQQSDYTGQYWYAICNDCGIEYPLKADNRLDAVREWNECKGVGEMQMTNEEWRKTCPMEEYATWLWKYLDHGEVIILWEKYGCPMHKDDNGVNRADYTEVMKKWLKEIHK